MKLINSIFQFFHVLLRAIFCLGFSHFHFSYHQPLIGTGKTDITLIISQEAPGLLQEAQTGSDTIDHTIFQQGIQAFSLHIQQSLRIAHVAYQHIQSTFVHHVKPRFHQMFLGTHVSNLSDYPDCILMIHRHQSIFYS